MSIKDVVESKFGKGSIFRVSEKDTEDRLNPSDFISSGSKALNYALTGNYECGYPRGRVVEVYGPEGTGKTTLALHVSKEAGKLGLETTYIDLENALDFNYGKKIGINVDNFFVTYPECGEDAFQIAEDILRDPKNNCGLIIFDSVASITPRAEIEGDMSDQQMGSHARLMGKGLRKLKYLLSKRKTLAFFINQVRAKIGGYGNPETTTGGNALKFFSDIRFEIRAPRSGKIMESSKGNLDDEVEEDSKGSSETGTKVNVKIIKNKIFPPYKICSLNVIYGKGIDQDIDLLRFFEMASIIQFPSKSEKKILYGGKTYLKDKFLKRVREDKDFKKKIKKEIELCQKR